MEIYQIIILLAFTSLTTGLTVSLMSEKKRSRNLSRQLNELNSQSEEDVYARGKLSELGLMSAGIAHEISNPLSVILGKTEQMLKGDRIANRENVVNGINQIKVNAERIANVIQSMREYIYRNDDAVEDFIPLKDIVDNVLVFCGQRLKSHGIELKIVDFDKVYVSGHKGQYEQAILNLINNSFDAIDDLKEKKWIEISAVKTSDTVQIFFKDSGLGIPVEVRSKMLEPFFSTKKGKGTGLGLPLVKGIAQKHGGNLTYVDAPNTTFLLVLPQASALQYQQ